MISEDGWFVGSRGGGLYQIPTDVDWTRGNERFSGGMDNLADYIHQKGFKAGIWLSPFGVSNSDTVENHPDWWVRKNKDGPFATSNIGWHCPLVTNLYFPAGAESRKT